MAILIKTLSAIFLVFVFGVAVEAIGCGAKDDPAPVDTESMTDFILNFNDAPIPYNTWLTSPYNMTLGSLTLTIYGPLCRIAAYYGLGSSSTWQASNPWYPDGGAALGNFLGLGDETGAFCELTFSEPISAFSIRVASFISWEAGVFIYDESGEEINCRNFPFVTVPNSNAYSIRGFDTTTTNNIKKIVIKDSYAVANLLRGTFCSGGKSLRDGKCQFPDPCIVDPYPCGANSNCTSDSLGNPVCACLEYYEGDADTECTPVTCDTAGSLCSPDATCSELPSEPFIDCTCNDGYEGTGFGLGCTPIASPETASPSTNTPNGASPSATPGQKTNVGSMAVASVTSAIALCLFFIA